MNIFFFQIILVSSFKIHFDLEENIIKVFLGLCRIEHRALAYFDNNNKWNTASSGTIMSDFYFISSGTIAYYVAL